MIKVGVIGYGMSAKVFHLPLIIDNEQFQLTAICTSQNKIVSEKYPLISTYPTVNEFILHSGVDLVVITTPNDTHFAIVKSCLENGLHVVIEKPVTATSAEAEELVQLAEKHQLTLNVFHNRRWDGDFLTVKKLLNNDSLGEIRLFESHFDRFRPVISKKWKEHPGVATGVWFDLGAHLVDQALCLFGLPTSVTASCLALRDNSKTTDYFHVQLHYPELEVILHSSPYAAGPNSRFTIQGTKGCFVKHGLDIQEEQLKKGMLPSQQTFGEDKPEHYGILYSNSKESTTISEEMTTEHGDYPQFYSAIAEAINNGEPVPVSGEDAVNVIKILELAVQSSIAGQTITFK